MTKTTEAQKLALVKIVYPKLTSSAAKNKAKVGKFHIHVVVRPDVQGRLIDMGLATFTWEKKMFGNEPRDVSVFRATAEGKLIAREHCKKLIAKKR